MWYIHTVEYYLIIRRNEIWIHAIMWMNFVTIMLNKRARQKRSHVTWCHSYKMFRVSKYMDIECRLEVVLGSPGWPSWLSCWLLILAQVLISGLEAVSDSLSLPLFAPPCSFSLSLSLSLSPSLSLAPALPPLTPSSLSTSPPHFSK